MGYFIRYFAKSINSSNYFEINKKTYDDIKDKEGKYDYNLYEIGSIAWTISGNRVYQTNSNTIKKAQNKYKKYSF